MQDFEFWWPTQMQCGPGIIKSLPTWVEQLNGTSILLVADPGVIQAGLLQKVETALAPSQARVIVFSDIESDPDVRCVYQGVDIAKQHGCDLVVGVGGGSVLDVAKAIAIVLKHPGDIRDYLGVDQVPGPGIPVIAIPTTAGTGSEVTVWSVLTDKETDQKVIMGSYFNCPRVALLDPELTLTLPPKITAATGMDALTHAIEAYVNKASHIMVQATAEKAIALIADNLRYAVLQGDHLQARQNMLIASSLAGVSFNRVRCGVVHAFSLPLGNQFHIPHGMVNAIMLTPCMRFNAPAQPVAFAKIAELFGEDIRGLTVHEAAQKAVVAVQRLKQDIGLTETLADYKVTPDQFDRIIDEAMQSGNMAVNPRTATREDMRQLLLDAMSGF